MIATGRGRPLRFLMCVTSGWITARVALLWPHLDSAASLLRVIAPIAVAAATPNVQPLSAPSRASLAFVDQRDTAAPAVAVTRAHSAPDPTRVTLALLALARYGEPQPAPAVSPILPGLPRAVPAKAPSRRPSRWSGSFWLVARSGAGLAPGALGGQLGGSQAGARLVYALDRKHRVALVARVTTPLGSGLREGSLGVEWQPTKLPVRLVAEQRFALSAGHGGPAIGIVGGIGPVGIPLGFRLEAYGQAGVIRRADSEPYADGAVRIAHPLGQLGATRIDLGAGTWGGAQRGAARLDIGPSLGVTVPLGKQPVRFAFDWRQRVAGDAHPGSGPALTLGADF